MTREEWLDYFETVNGRKPSVQEMADALKVVLKILNILSVLVMKNHVKNAY